MESYPFELVPGSRRINVRFADTTLINEAANGTPVDLKFAYTLAAGLKAVFAAPEVNLPKPKLAVEVPGGVQASFDSPGACNDTLGGRRRRPTSLIGMALGQERTHSTAWRTAYV